jgi:hypothetical protein
MRYKGVILLLLHIVFLHYAKSQDTIVLVNNNKVICTVTKIYNSRIEYLNFGDTVKRVYYSYNKADILQVRYADGKVDTFNANFFTRDSSDADTNVNNSYQKGYEAGYTSYRVSGENTAGVLAGLGNFIVPYAAIFIPIAYTVIKVPDKNISDQRFIQNKNELYRKGYIEGATKRRRRAVWHSYGITTGTCLVGIVALLSQFTIQWN